MEEFVHSSYIANCALNTFLSYTAIMLNSVTIYAIRKTYSLPKTLRMLLLSLAFSDLGVGLLVQPLFVTFLVTELKQNTEDNAALGVIHYIYLTAVNLLAFASFFGVMIISADRFLAIHLHLRYQEHVTYKRVVAVVILTWVLSVGLSLISLWIPVHIYYAVFAILYFSFMSIATFMNYKIFVAVRHHTREMQIQAQQVAHNDEMVNIERLRKSAVTAGWMYLLFMICYLPDTCIFWIITIASNSMTTQQVDNVFLAQTFTSTLVFLNSSLNPVIFCWKINHVRHNVINILRKTFSSHN